MGSLLAPPFGLLPLKDARTMMESASRVLVAPGVGVRTVFPVDFNTDSVKASLKLVDNEAGDPYLYINGGVWPHSNAWYSLALQSTGRLSEAFSFFRETMTLEGIVHSPMGHPAMYEYRFSDQLSPEYGRIDKPSFLWAGGFFLLTLYRLLGVSEGEWNISLGNGVPGELRSARYDLWFHGWKSIAQTGEGGEMRSLTVNGRALPCRVMPMNLVGARNWNITFGKATDPYLDAVNAIVRDVAWDGSGRKLTVELESFGGHRVVARVVSPRPPARAVVDGKSRSVQVASPADQGTPGYEIEFPGREKKQVLEVSF